MSSLPEVGQTPGPSIAKPSIATGDAQLRASGKAAMGDAGTTDAASRAKDEPESEFLAMVRLISHMVQACFEVLLDVMLFCSLVFAICMPWRTLAVLETAVPDRREAGWRIEFRKRAVAHIVGAVCDLLLLPIALIAVLIPTRCFLIFEAFEHRNELGTDFNVGYSAKLRIFILAQFGFGLLDGLCYIPVLLILLHPWRASLLISGTLQIVRDADQGTSIYSSAEFAPTEGRWGAVLTKLRKWWMITFASTLLDIPMFVCGLTSLLIPTRIMPMVTELKLMFPERAFYYYHEDKYIESFNWTEFHILCISNLIYGLIDIVTLPFLLLATLTIVRALPLVADLTKEWPNCARYVIVEFDPSIRGGGVTGQRSRWSQSRSDGECTHPEEATNESQLSEARTSGSAGTMQNELRLHEEINGRYQICGLYHGGPRFRRVLSNTENNAIELAQRPAFLFFVDGVWQICLSEDLETAVFRYKATKPSDRRDPTCLMQSQKFELRKGTPGSSSIEEDRWTLQNYTEGRVRMWGPAENEDFLRFGSYGFNHRLRIRCFQHALFLFMDAVFLPAVLVIMLTLYRIPGMMLRMREDALHRLVLALDVPTTRGGVLNLSDWEREEASRSLQQNRSVGHYGYNFGWRSRFESLRQCLLMLCDLAVLPCLFVVACTIYRLEFLKGRFAYYDLSWHFLVFLHANVVLFDTLLIPPAAFVMLTVYRWRYVMEAFRSRPAEYEGEVDWSWRIEVLKQAGLILCDLCLLPAVLLIFITRYRWSHVSGRFEPSTLSFHLAVLRSIGWVLLDSFILGPLVLAMSPFVHRLMIVCRTMREPPPPSEFRAQDPQNRVREEVGIQLILVMFDIFAFPCALLVFVTQYRWKHVKQHLASLWDIEPGNGAKFHLAVFVNAGIVLHDAFLMLPAALLLLCSVYRRQIVVDGLTESFPQVFDRPWTAAQVGEIDTSGAVEDASGQNDVGVDHTDHIDEFAGEDAMDGGGPPTDYAPQEPRDNAEPRQWHEITNQLIAADPDWGELVDWNAAPRLPDPDRFSRWKLWQEMGGLLIDLPFLLAGLLVAVFCWRLPVLMKDLQVMGSGRQRRKAVLWQLAFTFRDIVLLPFLLLIMLTPYAIQFLLQLCARRREALRSAPEFEVRRIEIRVPEFGKSWVRMHVNLVGQLSQLELDSLCLQLVGSDFWRGLTGLKGKALISFVQSRFPVYIKRNLTDAYAVVNGHGRERPSPGAQQGEQTVRQAIFYMESPIGVRRSRLQSTLAGMPQQEWVLVQLEGKDAETANRHVICRVAVQLSTLHAIVNEGSGEISSADFGNQDVISRCQGARHRGVADSFAPLVGETLLHCVIDFLHLLLFLVLLLVPWRFATMVRHLVEPMDRWPCRVSEQAMECMADLDKALQELNSCLLPACNAVAKDPEVAAAWCSMDADSGIGGAATEHPPTDPTTRTRTPCCCCCCSRCARWMCGGEASTQSPEAAAHVKDLSVPAEIQRFSCDALREQRQLSWMLSQLIYSTPEIVSTNIKAWRAMQDARLYYTALKSYTNCLLSVERITVEEHGVIMGQAELAEASFIRASGQIRQDIERAHRQCLHDAHKACWKSCGFWQKDSATKRKIVRMAALAAAMDLASILMCLLVVLTLYRVPRLVMDICRQRAFQPTSNRFKAIVVRNVRACVLEIACFAEVFLLWVFLLITLIRFLAAAEEAFAIKHSLWSIRKMLRRQSWNVFTSLWEIIMFFASVRTYRLIFRAVMYVCLVPPACLTELVNRLTMQRLKLAFRLLVSVLMFYLFAFSPAFTRLPNPPADAAVVRGVFAGLLLLILVCNQLSVMQIDTSWRLDDQTAVLPVMRWSWGNATAVGALLFQPACLAGFLISRHSNHMSWLAASCATSDALAKVAIGLVTLWLVLVSLMFVMGQSDEHVHLQRSPVLRTLQTICSQLLSTPMVLSLLGPSLGDCDQGIRELGVSPLECALLVFLACHMLTTQMFSCDSNLLQSLTWESNLDVRYPIAYIMVAQLADWVIVLGPLCTGESRGAELIITLMLVTGSALWTAFYSKISGSPPCCVPHLVVARLGGNWAVFWVSGYLLLELIIDSEIWNGALFIGILLITIATLFAIYRMREKAVYQHQQMLEKTGVSRVVQKLARIEEDLCLKECMVPSWADSVSRSWWQNVMHHAFSYKTLSLRVLELEEHLLAERLSGSFLRHRSTWRDKILQVSGFAELSDFAEQLCDGVASPSTVPALTQTGRQLLGREDLARGLVNFLVGHERLTQLLAAALFATPSSATSVDMSAHCQHARAALEFVLSYFRHDPRSDRWSESFSWEVVSGRAFCVFGPSGVVITSMPEEFTSAWYQKADALQRPSQQPVQPSWKRKPIAQLSPETDSKTLQIGVEQSTQARAPGPVGGALGASRGFRRAPPVPLPSPSHAHADDEPRDLV